MYPGGLNPMKVFMTSVFGNPNYNGYMGNNLYNNNNNFWKNGYNVAPLNNRPQQPTQNQMYNCVFKTTEGFSFNIPFSGTRTVEDLVLTFFRRVDQEQLFTQEGRSRIAFFYNASKIEYHSQKKVTENFKTNISPVIMVIDEQGLIGA